MIEVSPKGNSGIVISESPAKFFFKKIKWGYAERVGNIIYMNENLWQKEWKTLAEWVVKHEAEHTDELMSWDDMKHDLKTATSLQRTLFWQFLIKHPRAWVHFSPVTWRKDLGDNWDVCVNWTQIALYVLITVIGGFLYWWLLT